MDDGDQITLDSLVQFLASLADLQDAREGLKSHANTQILTCASRLGSARALLQQPMIAAIEAVTDRAMAAMGELAYPIETGLSGAIAAIMEMRGLICDQCSLTPEGVSNESKTALSGAEILPGVLGGSGQKDALLDQSEGVDKIPGDLPRDQGSGCAPVDVHVHVHLDGQEVASKQVPSGLPPPFNPSCRALSATFLAHNDYAALSGYPRITQEEYDALPFCRGNEPRIPTEVERLGLPPRRLDAMDQHPDSGGGGGAPVLPVPAPPLTLPTFQSLASAWLTANPLLTPSAPGYVDAMCADSATRDAAALACPITYPLGLTNAQCGQATPAWLQWANVAYNLPGIGVGVFPGGDLLARAFSTQLHTTDILVGALLLPCSGNRGTAGLAVALRTAIGALEHWGVGGMPWITTALEHVIHHNCPTELPSAQEAVSQYLAGAIDLQRAVCIAQTNGLAPIYTHAAISAGRQRFSIDQSIALERRGLMTATQLHEEVRGQGWIGAQDTQLLAALTDVIPSISDLITFMTRDVADVDLVTRFKMDAEFEDKWTGNVAQWGEWQGISEDLARAHWRAHWHLPSPTQLFDFWRRLRHLPDDDPARVELEDVRAALIQQDILPYWIDSYMAIAFHPLTRTDVKRAFSMGVIDRDVVLASNYDKGYSDENAEILTKFAERERLRSRQNSPAVRTFLRGGYDERELLEVLAEDGITPVDAGEIVAMARRKMAAVRREKCLLAVKKRYMYGELDDATAGNVLMSDGHDVEDASHHVATWRCQRASRGKEIPATKLCQWHSSGLITTEDYAVRLIRLGYVPDDIDRLMRQCDLTLTAKQQKALERAALAAAREAQKTAKEEERVDEKAVKQRERMAQAQERSVAARQQRERQMTAAGLKIAKETGEDYPVVAAALRSAYTAARAQWGLTPAETLSVIVEAARVSKEHSLLSIITLIREAAQRLRYAGLTPPDVEPAETGEPAGTQ